MGGELMFTQGRMDALDQMVELSGNLAAALADNERISGLLSAEVARVAELEGELRVFQDLRDGQAEYLKELQAQLDRATSEAKEWHEEVVNVSKRRDAWARDNDELRARLDRKPAEPRPVDVEHVCTVTVVKTSAGDPPSGPEMTLDEAVEFSGGSPDRIRADSLEFECERLRRLREPRPMSEAVDGLIKLYKMEFDERFKLQAQLDRAKEDVGEGESERSSLRKYNAEYRDELERLREQLGYAKAEIEHQKGLTRIVLERETEPRPQEPRPMSEAPRDASVWLIRVGVWPTPESMSVKDEWAESHVIGWLPTTTATGGSESPKADVVPPLKCHHCSDAKWVWDHELPSPPDETTDQRYPCPYCDSDSEHNEGPADGGSGEGE